MDITVTQALLVAIFAGFAGIDAFDGLTHFHRPLVSGVVVGFILGNLEMGILAGGVLEFIFMGAVPVGGAQPPNVVIGGIIGTAFAIIMGQDPKAAIGIAIPFAVAVQALITLLFTAYAPVMSYADRCADKLNFKGISAINYLGMAILFVGYFLVAFLPIYFGAESAGAFAQALPKPIIDGLGYAGGMLPAVGFAVLLKVMFRRDLLGFFALGFLLSAYLNLPILAVAGFGIIIAIYVFMSENRQSGAQSSKTEDFSNGI